MDVLSAALGCRFCMVASLGACVLAYYCTRLVMRRGKARRVDASWSRAEALVLCRNALTTRVGGGEGTAEYRTEYRATLRFALPDGYSATAHDQLVFQTPRQFAAAAQVPAIVFALSGLWPPPGATVPYRFTHDDRSRSIKGGLLQAQVDNTLGRSYAVPAVFGGLCTLAVAGSLVYGLHNGVFQRTAAVGVVAVLPALAVIAAIVTCHTPYDGDSNAARTVVELQGSTHTAAWPEQVRQAAEAAIASGTATQCNGLKDRRTLISHAVDGIAEGLLGVGATPVPSFGELQEKLPWELQLAAGAMDASKQSVVSYPATPRESEVVP